MKRERTLSMTVLALAGGLFLQSCKRQMQMPVSNDYPTMAVSKSTKTIQQEYSATVKGCNDVDIYPQVSGTITAICAQEGARVTKGQTLFVINQVPYQANYERAKANVKSAEASLATAKLTLDSKQQLYEQHVVSSFDLTQARNSYQSAEAVLAQAKADLTKARNDLSYTTVTSPVSGVAGMISLRVGALVSEQMAEPLITVSDDSRMYAYFSLSEQKVLEMSKQTGEYEDFAALLPAVSLRQSDGSIYGIDGKIDAVSGIVDRQTGAVSVRATFPNPNHELRSGSSASVIVPRTVEDCIVIPQTATFEIQDRQYVYRVIDGKTQSTEVKTMNVDGKEFIVTQGLEVGDVIVSEGAGLLRNGVEVNIKQ